jgi:hypothetical protein
MGANWVLLKTRIGWEIVGGAELENGFWRDLKNSETSPDLSGIVLDHPWEVRSHGYESARSELTREHRSACAPLQPDSKEAADRRTIT